MKNILVTGGAGFIGANFVEHFVTNHPEYKVINLDLLTYAGDINNLKEVEKAPNYEFIHGDICDKHFIDNLFKTYQFSDVIHFAAESHVDNSITGPEAFVKTNVLGTFNLLDAARNLWMEKPNQYKEAFKNSRFHHISTDEVYGTLGETGLFLETTPYAPNSPYSASKAASDMLVRSYFHTYGMNVVTTNCSNNYGPKQHDEKLIPTIIRKCLAGENIPIYGDGKNVRDWLYVLDHCKGIELVFYKGKAGETYNIGGRNERNNLQIVHTICELLNEIEPKKNGTYQEQITFVTDRPGHDLRYAIDATKLETELGWKADENFETGIKKTIAWYLKKYKN
ncbi:dTDP-glucose 4,6-dehydratase [Flavobacterium agricola]|uniref:dTDP-glucose 4,6-dehydratase n=1 Tax=Flavobacterium agricola TaxID=2870839 RepID=A0ABY6M250_9FLAO|nr:dTDP-glucose 4,6-dehydratase [Flavobacterium agricola]UYW00953.1 dTDP-glucose 4,6-dehydratase [Flavobacterium agricola]